MSLLILKILYLLFTTSGTQEYFYTNDLCVLVDVFIRELYNLDEDSEGVRPSSFPRPSFSLAPSLTPRRHPPQLKHTYLRVLHPLLTNTQLRQHAYKRPELRRCLESLVAQSHYRACDPTTRRLVERNLRASWCQTLRSADAAAAAAAALAGLGMAGGSKSATGSTLSVDAVAVTGDDEAGGGGGGASAAGQRHRRKGPRRHASVDDEGVAYGGGGGGGAVGLPSVVREGHAVVGPVGERSANGDAPEAVRASVAAAEARAEENERERSWTRSPEDEHAPHAFPLPDRDVPTSVASISAGHELLAPVAARHHGSSTPTYPLPTSTGPTLVTPRPRSHSLHASHKQHEHPAHTHFRPAPPPPHPTSDSPDPPHHRPPSSHSSRSSSQSSTAAHTQQHHVHHAHLPSYHPAHHHSHAPVGALSSASASATAAARRRRPPPPPAHHAYDGGSRPRTPCDTAPPSPVSVSGLSVGAGTSTRRRPPPPPGAGAGRGSPRGAASAVGSEGEDDEVRRGVEALAVR